MTTIKLQIPPDLLAAVDRFIEEEVPSASRTDAMVAALRAIHDARDADPLVRHAVPAIHVEGPHIAPDDGPRGAHPLAHVRAPDLALFARLQAASGGLIGLASRWYKRA